jgi:hypothetical protein
MASIDFDRRGRSGHREDRRDYLAIMAVTYPIFLAAVATARIVGLVTGRTQPRGSVFVEAWRASASAIPFVFR